MSKQFEFADFIEEFQVEFTAFISSGKSGWDRESGDYVESVIEPVQTVGIILPLSEDDLKYAPQGTYSEKSKKLYVLEPMELNQEIEYKSDRYVIQSFKDYSDYADVYIYYAAWRDKGGSEA
ncbi:hypothetical protein [Priestia aryabhattai]|uniref:Uncharacterized protein n=1 Tax=Priestia aryabhattai TaxID=412384 RepID=A0ABD7X383_PRIAR|nr:hypothetical protein [Priestia aryabhattai]WEA46813.1 hypothetical protein PWO00_12875 [Priestia aryabhattai]